MKTLLLSGFFLWLFCPPANAQWRYSSETDRMTHQVKHKLTILGTAGTRIDVVCQNSKAYPFFYISTGSLEVKVMPAGRGDIPGTPIRLRFDQDKPEQSIIAVTDKQHRGGLISVDVEKLVNAKRLALEYTSIGRQQQIATFHLLGLEAAMRKYHCGR